VRFEERDAGPYSEFDWTSAVSWTPIHNQGALFLGQRPRTGEHQREAKHSEFRTHLLTPLPRNAAEDRQ
jgi:hypothetical protein